MDVLASLTPERRRLLAVALAIVLGLVLAPRLVQRGAATRAAPPPLRVARPAPAPRLVVDVAGAVRRPGLYRLRGGSRVDDAVRAAGGPTARAALDAVNLAAPLADGVQVVVPVRGAAGVAAPAPGGSANGPVDLNSATAEQLDALPGIGPTTAAKIVEYRQAHGAFRSLAELDAVPGIGAGRLAQLKGLVTPP